MRSNRGKNCYKRTLIALAALLTLGCSFVPSASAANPLSWSAPVKVEASGFPLDSVSCTSETFCMAVSTHGNASTYNGSSWSSAAKIDTEQLFSVSCTSETFCIAVTNGADGVTYNGSLWSAPVEINGNATILESVSCTSETFCMAVGTAEGKGFAFRYNGSSWSSAAKIDTVALDSVSCVSAVFCVAVDSIGNELTYSGGPWSVPVKIDTVALDSVSCVSAVFCVAVDHNGHALTYNGSLWGAPVEITVWQLNSVSCTSSTFCVTVDYNGNAITYNGISWSVPIDIDHGVIFHSVSCIGMSFCVAVDNFGYALTYTESSLPLPVNIKPPTISGSAVQGQTLLEVHGEWSGNPTEYSYQWERCASSGGSCEAVASAVAQTYLLTATDVGHTIRVTETAKNSSGTGIPASSVNTVVVQAPPHPVVQCIVPKLKGKTLTKAGSLLVQAHCKLGKVSISHKRHRRHTRHKLVVVSQKSNAGKVLPFGAKIAVRLG